MTKRRIVCLIWKRKRELKQSIKHTIPKDRRATNRQTGMNLAEAPQTPKKTPTDHTLRPDRPPTDMRPDRPATDSLLTT